MLIVSDKKYLLLNDIRAAKTHFCKFCGLNAKNYIAVNKELDRRGINRDGLTNILATE